MNVPALGVEVTIADSGPPGLLPMGTGGYELGERLATGGMAELFVAQRIGAGGVRHPVVVKRLRESMLGDPTVVRMFEWEAWISSRLRHPNVVAFHDFVVVDRRHHLVLEYVHGCDLAQLASTLWRAERHFPLADAVRIATSVALALDHAHGLRDDAGRRVGLVHRDVSPHNVVLSVDGEIKIIDFGVAKTTRVARDTGAGLIKGKMGYHAPEQLRGDPLDGRSDLFGLGVVLTELVMGSRLHPSDEGLAELLSPRVPPLRELRPECPRELEALLAIALSPTPAGRFANAKSMATALAEVGRILARKGHVSDLASLVANRVVRAPEPTSVPNPALVPTTPRDRRQRRSTPPAATLPDARIGGGRAR
jgi:serine/threonine-protein kinase